MAVYDKAIMNASASAYEPPSPVSGTPGIFGMLREALQPGPAAVGEGFAGVQADRGDRGEDADLRLPGLLV